MGKILEREFPERSYLLNELAKFGRRKNIVEIGVCTGDATVLLCEAASEYDGHVWGYDLWAVHGLKRQFAQKGTKEGVAKRIQAKGFNNFTLTKIDSTTQEFKDLIKKNTPKIDFCFIDGCHSYKGIKNDFDVVYPLLTPEATVVFHDTCKIDGCREFIIDLRTKLNDGTYDIIDLPWDNGTRRVGVSILQKRSYATQNWPIDEICGSPSNPAGIYKKEKDWYAEELNRYKNNGG